MWVGNVASSVGRVLTSHAQGSGSDPSTMETMHDLACESKQ